MIRLQVTIDDQLHIELRNYCFTTKEKVKDVVIEAIKEYLNNKAIKEKVSKQE